MAWRGRTAPALPTASLGNRLPPLAPQVREIFKLAKTKQAAIIFFDEIDAGTG